MIKKTLEKLTPELVGRFHVHPIRIFGSVVRKDFSAASDINIIVDFNRPVGIEFIDLANYFKNKLNQKADLVSKNGIGKKYYKIIEQEIVYV